MEKNYYIGLDIGTSSVGFAVTDEDYNLIKAGGKDYWGAFLFDEAVSAVERRGYRTARRRQARRRYRLNLLEELFNEEIAKKDFSFFIRLKNSAYYLGDKEEDARAKYPLFNDKGFTDKDFYKRYPTIFHLRKALISEEITDIRLLFLGVHHIVKNRGHFLYEGQNFKADDPEYMKEGFGEINAYLESEELPLLNDKIRDGIYSLLCDEKIRRADKKSEIKKLMPAMKDKSLKARYDETVNALLGYQFAVKKLFDAEEDFEEAPKLAFDGSFDEKFGKIYEVLGDERAAFINALKKIHDLASLQNILQGEKYLSAAKVKSYEKHKSDLKALKDYVRRNCPEKYFAVFKDKSGKLSNYPAYVKQAKPASKDDFYAFLKKEVRGAEAAFPDIADGTFLPKQITGDNCVIPYQLNEAELRAILKNAEKYFPFLSEKDSSNLSVSEKILSLLTFRVPYYVGPFNSKAGDYRWIVKREGKETDKITPWTFDKIVDKDASEQAFIRRMTNKCTYLTGEDVLPVSSFLYSEFTLLNELNNLKVNGERRGDVKKILFSLAKREKKLTLKKCLAELIKSGVLPEGSSAGEVFSGTDGDIKGSLSSYIDFKKVIGEKADLYPDMCEEIILWITIISDKGRLAKMIKEKYGKIISENEIKSIKSLNYTKWGRLSKELLTGIYETDKDGVIGGVSIIEHMRETTDNFMETLSSKYGYSRTIEAEREAAAGNGATYKTVEELACSPAVKRSIWSAVKIVKEITKVSGCAPKKIFIEMTREQKDPKKQGKRTVTRKQQLLDLYKNIKDEARDWISEIENTDDKKFDSDKVFFYYLQMGVDVYTGENIPVEEIFDVKLYDIDHIYPRSKIKDDSLNNRVLVSKSYNEHVKKDVYPLPAATRSARRALWTSLKNKGLMSDEKYYRLTRSTPITADECAEFINRQLVFTAQSTKAVADILKAEFSGGTEICYSKAGNADDFKKRIGLIKIRDLNDLHHAKDAYVNIVSGNVFNVKFEHDAKFYFRKYGVEKYNLLKLYDFDIAGAWKKGDENRILSIAEKNTCRVIRYAQTGKGKMFNANPLKAGTNLIPLKERGPLSNTERYGGYSGVQAAYLMLVRSKDKKGNVMLSLERVSILDGKRLSTEEDLKKYLSEKCDLKEPEILIKKIKLGSLFSYDGAYVYLAGATDKVIEFRNARQLYLDKESVIYLKKVTNYLKDVKNLKNEDLKVKPEITKEQNIALYDVLREKFASKAYRGLAAFKKVLKTLENGRTKFIALTEEKQCKVISLIFNTMKIKTDLSLIGGSTEEGRIRPSNNITDHRVKLINLSPTGYYAEVIDFDKFKTQL